MNIGSFINLLDYFFYSSTNIGQIHNDIQNEFDDKLKIKCIFNTQYPDSYNEIKESETDLFIIRQNFSSDDKDSIEEQMKVVTEDKKPFFVVAPKKNKRGRHSSRINIRCHSALSYDNIQRKIQVHFLNFVVCFLNDVICALFKSKKYLLSKFAHTQKRVVSKRVFDTIKSFRIKDIFISFSISEKYKKKGNRNINNIEYLSKFEIFEKLFNMNYLAFFKKYYYNDNKFLDEIDIGDKRIKVSKKTKSLLYLLEDKKNNSIKYKIIHVIKNEYFNDIKQDDFFTFIPLDEENYN